LLKYIHHCYFYLGCGGGGGGDDGGGFGKLGKT
jgi:hypothetical protein